MIQDLQAIFNFLNKALVAFQKLERDRILSTVFDVSILSYNFVNAKYSYQQQRL